jgi:hypothetical protein
VVRGPWHNVVFGFGKTTSESMRAGPRRASVDAARAAPANSESRARRWGSRRRQHTATASLAGRAAAVAAAQARPAHARAGPDPAGKSRPVTSCHTGIPSTAELRQWGSRDGAAGTGRSPSRSDWETLPCPCHVFRVHNDAAGLALPQARAFEPESLRAARHTELAARAAAGRAKGPTGSGARPAALGDGLPGCH